MSKRTPSFRMPLILQLWSKGLMPKGIGTKRRDDYPEELRGDMYYEKPPLPQNTPSYQTEDDCHSVAQPLTSLEGETCATEPLSDCAAELLSDIPLPEYLKAVWESANQKTPPAIASRYFLPAMKQLVMLCHELQAAAGPASFYLACRHAAEITGVNYRTSSRCLARLEKDGVLQRISTGTVGRKKKNPKANEYRYIGG